MTIKRELFKMAYKKLKSSLYYDKTQSIARDKLVEFEASNKDIDAYIEEFAEAVLDEKKRDGIFKERPIFRVSSEVPQISRVSL